MAYERHSDFRAYELDSSTRQSAHPYTKYAPIREALSTTAETLFTAGVGEIASNWVTNPRVEAALSASDGFTATGAGITRSTGLQAAGAASLLVNPANSAVGEGFYWESPSIAQSVNAQFLSVQLEHQGASAASAVKLEIRDAAGTTVLATSGTSNLAASWVRITASYAIPPLTAAASYRLYLTTVTQHNINFSADKIMFEVRDDTVAVSTYVDGSVGLNYMWSGTENASTSFKRPGMTMMKGITLKNESGTGAEIVYVAFDTVATATNGIPILAGGTLENTWPLAFTDKISAISASGTPTVSGVIWGT
tara:strand:- start:305 stop:1231 length:927 start_codon:yes stop_codon:yes gene_type:complete